MILKCLCFLNKIRFKRRIYVFQPFYTKWSTHRQAQRFGTVNLPSGDEKQVPKTMSSFTEEFRRLPMGSLVRSSHWETARQLCTLSSHSPAQNCLGPLTAHQTLRHNFSHAHFLGSPKHAPAYTSTPSAAKLSTPQLALPPAWPVHVNHQVTMVCRHYERSCR